MNKYVGGCKQIYADKLYVYELDKRYREEGQVHIRKGWEGRVWRKVRRAGWGGGLGGQVKDIPDAN